MFQGLTFELPCSCFLGVSLEEAPDRHIWSDFTWYMHVDCHPTYSCKPAANSFNNPAVKKLLLPRPPTRRHQQPDGKERKNLRCAFRTIKHSNPAMGLLTAPVAQTKCQEALAFFLA